MPYSLEHTSPKCWSVVNTDTGKIHSKCSSKKKAQAQMRLLYGVESGWTPKKKGGSTHEDVISVDVPLMIRLLEYAREDAKTDMDLHKITENMLGLGKSVLSMNNYDDIVKQVEGGKIKNISSNKMSTWKDYVKKSMQGKKFSSRAEVNDFMKKISAEWKSKKGTGVEPLLLVPGLGNSNTTFSVNPPLKSNDTPVCSRKPVKSKKSVKDAKI